MRILLVDECPEDAFMCDIRDNYTVDVASSENEVLETYSSCDYDAVVVADSDSDNGTPQRNELLYTYSHVPLVMVLKDSNFERKVAALEAGADVCLQKPLNARELKAQLSALIRRRCQGKKELRILDVCVNIQDKWVTVNSVKINLRRKEYEVLEYLFINRNKIVSKEELLEHVWQDGIYVFSNTIEVHILKLRVKLKKYGSSCEIKTVRGFGYFIEG